jgi:hypothetical protein
MSLEELEKEYTLKASVFFEGNEDIEPFYGQIQGFEQYKDGIYVTLSNEQGDFIDLPWIELKDCEFDYDSFIE